MTDNNYRTVPTNPFEQLHRPVQPWGPGPPITSAALIDLWNFDGVELMVDWEHRLIAFKHPTHVEVYNMDDREQRWIVDLKETGQ